MEIFVLLAIGCFLALSFAFIFQDTQEHPSHHTREGDSIWPYLLLVVSSFFFL